MIDNNGFELVRDEHIAELNTRARIFRHIQTGAQVLSLENEDENKVFGISFRTPVSDSTGVPHIMEHSVLCGSRKYPVKEPFVELLKGSLNTFLNAMTFSDKTCYPVASQNLQDFYNLVDVYLDAVFFPRLSPYTLMQEGWHYEVEEPDQPLAFKGVVFNEMKGAYSQPDSVFSDQIQYSLFPNNSYQFDSGGNPAAIPDLTFEQFKAFHETYYHPSNALIFFYGDDDPEQRLVVLDEYLRLFEAIPVKSEIALQPQFTEPRRIETGYEAGEDQADPKSFVAVNWLLPETGDTELVYGLSVLEQILIGTPASQLRKALIDSGLGEDLAGRGLETSSRQMFFSAGMRGVKPGKENEVEKLVIDTLARLAIEGLDQGNISAAMNTIEFRLRENNTGSMPRGLIIMLRALDFWNYGKDPLEPLAFEKPLNSIKARLAGGEPYFEHLIEAYLINNSHRTTVILSPDSGLSEKREAAERDRLSSARAQMSDEEIQAAIKDSHTLREMQETPDSPEMLMTIPMLDRGDLDKEIRRIPIDVQRNEKSQVVFHDLFTNGILYMDLGFNLQALPQEWVPYIPLFGRALLETGTEKESFVQLLQRIGQSTGGIRPSTLTSASRAVDAGPVTWLFLRGKAMTSQADHLLAIFRDVLTGANFHNQERFRQMAMEEKARLESRLVDAGHAVVNSRLRARDNEADWAAEQMGGVSYLFFLRNLVQQIESDWEQVAGTLTAIRDRLVVGQNCLANITLDAASWRTIEPQVDKFLNGLPDGKVELQKWALPSMPEKEGLTIPAQVNYVGKGANLYKNGYRLEGSAFVVTNHLYGSYLWDKIRVQGGAYGGMLAFDNQSGMLNFLSYRDPNVVPSLEVYDATSSYLKSLELDESEVDKAVIGTIGDLDAYQLPDAKGFTSLRFYLLSLSDEERQRLRDEVLNTTLDDFRRFGEALDTIKAAGEVVVLGSEEAIQKAGIFQDIKKIL